MYSFFFIYSIIGENGLSAASVILSRVDIYQ